MLKTMFHVLFQLVLLIGVATGLSSKLRIAVLDVAVFESYNYARGANQNSEDMMQNAKQYCALHGYDYLTTPKSYPLLTGEQGS